MSLRNPFHVSPERQTDTLVPVFTLASRYGSSSLKRSSQGNGNSDVFISRVAFIFLRRQQAVNHDDARRDEGARTHSAAAVTDAYLVSVTERVGGFISCLKAPTPSTKRGG
ncbi:hypothetical protein CEXT_218271 [Caerostris extrusa]|uniref:Uncharacterized protein n=1 Tax=Caerostris extrusa TaxID=172846 RepID=A0AAV4TYG6_CAEEX|nr:hypothetical protein CEXT_218271 [Caerostris extrusa]